MATQDPHLATKLDIAEVRTGMAQLETRIVKLLYGTLFAAVTSGVVGVVGILLQIFND